MMQRHERSLIFGSFIGVGVLVVGVVGYRAANAPLPRTIPVLSLSHDRMLPDLKRTDNMPPATSASLEAEVTTNITAPTTMPVRVTPVTVIKPEPERETVAMLPPAPARRERQYEAGKHSAVKTAQLDVCAKIGKKRVYYNKGNGKHWRCR